MAPGIYLGVDYVASINLRRIDLNLLTIFEAVYEEGSQQKASERLALTQPAVSYAITKFRRIADDKLFVGTRTMRPTFKATEIYEQLKPALDTIRKELFEKQSFDPSTTHRDFSIAVPYGGGYLFAEPLYRHLKAQAPHATLSIRSVDPESEIPRLLRQQEIDIAITSKSFDDPMLRSELCFEYEIGMIVSSKHPRINSTSTSEEILKERFIWVSGSGLERSPKTKRLQDFIDAAEQRVDMLLPNVLVVPTIVTKSDLVALLPWSFATKFANSYDVRSYRIPVEQQRDLVSLLWHSGYQNDPEAYWFRSVCMAAALEIRGSLGF